MLKRLVPWILIIVLSLPAVSGFAATPQLLSYQGVLTDGSGNIVPNGNYSITFRIYDDSALGGAHLLWTEAHDGVTAPLVPVSKGGFSVTLGTAIPVNAQFNAPMWMELQVAPDATPMSPRTALTPAPYALNARNIFDGGASNFVGIGRADRVYDDEFFGVQAPVGNGEYGGMYIQTQSAGGLPFYGYSAGSTLAWTYMDGADAYKWKVNNGGDRLVIDRNGNVGVGNTTPTTNLDITGGTRLGAGGPAIKMLKFTGVTAGAAGGSVIIPTGVPADKIIGVEVLVQYASSNWIPPHFTIVAGYEFNWSISNSNGNITIWNAAGNSNNILSRSIKMLVTYEE